MKYGQIFEKKIGRPPSEFENIIDLEKAAEKMLGRPLEVASFESPVVSKHGNVFPYESGMLIDINKKVSLLPK